MILWEYRDFATKCYEMTVSMLFWNSLSSFLMFYQTNFENHSKKRTKVIVLLLSKAVTDSKVDDSQVA